VERKKNYGEPYETENRRREEMNDENLKGLGKAIIQVVVSCILAGWIIRDIAYRLAELK
jgi:hypothetical protein